MNSTLYFKDFLASHDEDFSLLAEAIVDYNGIEDKDALYQSYYNAYAAKGLKPWEKSEYEWRAQKWTFAGILPKQGVPVEKIGMVTARNKNGVIKLTGMQGDNTTGKVRGMIELSKTGLPIWGAMDKDFTVRLQKLGFSSPPGGAMKLFFPVIQNDPQFSSGGSWDSINPDGSISFDLQGVGMTTKYFVGNKKFFRLMMDKVAAKHAIDPKMMSMIQKWKTMPQMMKTMAMPMLKAKGIDAETMDWVSEILSDDEMKPISAPEKQPDPAQGIPQQGMQQGIPQQ